jgi:hypothetical protein
VACRNDCKQLNLFGPGISLHNKGYLRYRSPVHLRNKYVHRVIVEKLIEETPYSIRLMLPQPFEVHHLDYNKRHNCPYNFLLVSADFHGFMSLDGGNRYRPFTKSKVKESAEPDWVTAESENTFDQPKDEAEAEAEWEERS